MSHSKCYKYGVVQYIFINLYFEIQSNPTLYRVLNLKTTNFL